jgi:hypothetical protein
MDSDSFLFLLQIRGHEQTIRMHVFFADRIILDFTGSSDTSQLPEMPAKTNAQYRGYPGKSLLAKSFRI